MPSRSLLALLLFAFATPLHAAQQPAEQWVVVTAPAYRRAVEPLCEQRKAQGMHVEVVRTTDVLSGREIRAGEADQLRDHVVKLCRDFRGTSYVLLVGAVEAGALSDPEEKVAPALRGTVGRMKGQPTDNGYGTPGEGLVPAVAVGRMPARAEAEARQMVRKTLAYEKDTAPGEWKRRLTVLASAPAFNPVVDALVESQAMAALGRIDPSWGGRVIYENPSSRFSLPADLCHDRALACVGAGQALTLYLGHSNAWGFWADGARYLDRADWGKLVIKRGPGVFVTFGCFGCQLCGKDGEGYGVAAARNPDGPVAVIGSHAECFAAMNKLAAEDFVESFLGSRRPQRLGESYLRLKEGIARGKIDGFTFGLLDAADGNPSIPQGVQRLEHEEMFVLLGDPALRLPWVPHDVVLTAGGTATPGGRLTLWGTVPAELEGAKVELTLERPRDSNPAETVVVPRETAEARAGAMVRRYEAANDFVVARKELTVKDGRFEAELDLPAKLPWRRLIARAYAATERHEGMGALTVAVGE